MDEALISYEEEESLLACKVCGSTLMEVIVDPSEAAAGRVLVKDVRCGECDQIRELNFSSDEVWSNH